MTESTEPKVEFIAFDWCGWGDRLGRYTHIPSSETLVCKGWMCQQEWDNAQLEWFKRFSGSVVVHRCHVGAYRETGDLMGTVAEIVGRLESRLAAA